MAPQPHLGSYPSAGTYAGRFLDQGAISIWTSLFTELQRLEFSFFLPSARFLLLLHRPLEVLFRAS
jgi:hypothetical protein